MCSPFRKSSLAAAASLGAALLLAGCDDSQNGVSTLPLSQGGPQNIAVSGLFPGGGTPPQQDPEAKAYEGNARAISEGERLFNWYNCTGCHFHGGGGIGPALMDNKWIYGDRMDQIYASIAQGRPNGMPAWGAKLAPDQIWKLAAYVKSLPQKAAKKAMPTTPPAAVPGPDTLETEPGQNVSN